MSSSSAQRQAAAATKQSQNPALPLVGIQEIRRCGDKKGRWRGELRISMFLPSIRSAYPHIPLTFKPCAGREFTGASTQWATWTRRIRTEAILYRQRPRLATTAHRRCKAPRTVQLTQISFQDSRPKSQMRDRTAAGTILGLAAAEPAGGTFNPAISVISLRRIATPNSSKERATTVKAPGPPMTRFS